jgi:hypothetical protein
MPMLTLTAIRRLVNKYMIIEFQELKHKVGTRFVLNRNSNHFEAEIIGYHVEYNTDTNKIDVTYRIQYIYLNQIVKLNFSRSVIDRIIGFKNI